MTLDSSAPKSKLKFKEPGFRDTVVKMNPGHAAEREPINPLLTKIKETLANSDPQKWEKYGEPLKPEVKYPKACEKWEIAYCIDLPNGLLTFRASLPVTSEYFGGGYTLAPTGKEIYTVELRPRAWDPRTLLDPFFRSTLEKDKQFKTLIAGDVAKDLFLLIEETFTNFRSRKAQGIGESIQDVANQLTSLVNNLEASAWERGEDGNGTVTYSTEHQGVLVEIIRSKKFDSAIYHLILSKDTIRSQIKDPRHAKELFNQIEERTKDASLEALQEVLVKAGF